MDLIGTLFFFFLLLQTPIPATSSPFGALTCAWGSHGLEGSSHLLASDVTEGILESTNLLIDGEAATDIPLGQPVELTVLAPDGHPTFKGFNLLLAYADATIPVADSALTLTDAENHQYNSICDGTPHIVGITHSNSDPKSEVITILQLDSPGLVSLQVTLVVQNSDDVSIFYHGNFQFQVVSPMVDTKQAADNSVMGVLLLQTQDGDQGYSTFVSALQSTGLDKLLQNLTGTYTLYAPINKAFTEMDNSTWTRWQTEDYTAHLKDAMARHVVLELLDSKAQVAEAQTAAPRKKLVIQDGKISTTATTATITNPDIPADNGVIHGVDVVLRDILSFWTSGKYVGFLDQDFSILSPLILASTWWTGDGEVSTLFAPTDDAFNAAYTPEEIAALTQDKDALAQLLKAHIAINNYPVESLMELDSIVMADGKSYEIATSAGGGVSVGGATVDLPNVFVKNGIVHHVGAVIKASATPQNNSTNITNTQPPTPQGNSTNGTTTEPPLPQGNSTNTNTTVPPTPQGNSTNNTSTQPPTPQGNTNTNTTTSGNNTSAPTNAGGATQPPGSNSTSNSTGSGNSAGGGGDTNNMVFFSLRYQFQEGQARDPTQAEVEELVCLTNLYFRERIQNLTGDETIQSQAMFIDWSYVADPLFPVTLNFTVNATTGSGEVVPVDAVRRALDVTTTDILNYIANYVWKTAQTSVFQKVMAADFNDETNRPGSLGRLETASCPELLPPTTAPSANGTTLGGAGSCNICTGVIRENQQPAPPNETTGIPPEYRDIKLPGPTPSATLTCLQADSLDLSALGQGATCPGLNEALASHCGCLGPPRPICRLCGTGSDPLNKTYPFKFEDKEYDCKSMDDELSVSNASKTCDEHVADIFEKSVDWRAYCCADTEPANTCGDLCPEEMPEETRGIEFVPVLGYTCGALDDVWPYGLECPDSSSVETIEVKEKCCGLAIAPTNGPTTPVILTMPTDGPSSGNVNSPIAPLTAAPTLPPSTAGTFPTEVPTGAPTQNGNNSPIILPPAQSPAPSTSDNSTLAPTRPSLPSDQLPLVTINASFVLTNQQGLRAVDVASPLNAIKLNRAFKDFTINLVQEKDGNRTIRFLRSTRRLAALLQPNSSKVLAVQDVVCPEGAPENSDCQNAYGKFDLLAVDEDPATVSSRYVVAVEEAITAGRLQESLDRADADFPFDVFGVAQTDKPAEEAEGKMAWWLILLIVLACVFGCIGCCCLLAYLSAKGREKSLESQDDTAQGAATEASAPLLAGPVDEQEQSEEDDTSGNQYMGSTVDDASSDSSYKDWDVNQSRATVVEEDRYNSDDDLVKKAEDRGMAGMERDASVVEIDDDGYKKNHDDEKNDEDEDWEDESADEGEKEDKGMDPPDSRYDGDPYGISAESASSVPSQHRKEEEREDEVPHYAAQDRGAMAAPDIDSDWESGEEWDDEDIGEEWDDEDIDERARAVAPTTLAPLDEQEPWERSEEMDDAGASSHKFVLSQPAGVDTDDESVPIAASVAAKEPVDERDNDDCDREGVEDEIVNESLSQSFPYAASVPVVDRMDDEDTHSDDVGEPASAPRESWDDVEIVPDKVPLEGGAVAAPASAWKGEWDERGSDDPDELILEHEHNTLVLEQAENTNKLASVDLAAAGLCPSNDSVGPVAPAQPQEQSERDEPPSRDSNASFSQMDESNQSFGMGNMLAEMDAELANAMIDVDKEVGTPEFCEEDSEEDIGVDKLQNELASVDSRRRSDVLKETRPEDSTANASRGDDGDNDREEEWKDAAEELPPSPDGSPPKGDK